VFGLLTVLSTQVGSGLISDDEIAAILLYRLKKKKFGTAHAARRQAGARRIVPARFMRCWF